MPQNHATNVGAFVAAANSLTRNSHGPEAVAGEPGGQFRMVAHEGSQDRYRQHVLVAHSGWFRRYGSSGC